MSESTLQVTEGDGPLLHVDNKSIGGQTVKEEYILHGEQALPSYQAFFSSVSIPLGTEKHPFELMAGASLKLRVREIVVFQQAATAAGTQLVFDIKRLSTAGTGGPTNPIAALDPSSPSSGATLMETPTAEGTEGDTVVSGVLPLTATLPNTGIFRWVQHPSSQPIVVPVSNGICMKLITAGGTGASIRGYIIFDASAH